MKLDDIKTIIDGQVVSPLSLNGKVFTRAFSSDLMSDVLTLKHDDILLITGLANLQTIRTAEMADITCIVFVRNKKVTPEMVEIAEEAGIALMECRYSMFKTSGLLYQAGLKPIY
jgi:hypothetical protein